MIAHVDNGFTGEIVDAQTGQKVRWVRWVNVDSGLYEAFSEDPVLARQRDPGCWLRGLLYRGKARLPVMVAQAMPQLRPAHAQLTPQQEAQQIRSIARDYVKDYKPIVPTPGIECEERLCHRLATWQTGDEQLIDAGYMPDGGECERAVTTRVHRYCDRHFRPPVQRSLRGVEIELHDVVRPQ